MYSRSGLVRQGIDLAVIDAIGRDRGLSAATVLGGAVRPSVEVCYPVFRLTPAESGPSRIWTRSRPGSTRASGSSGCTPGAISWPSAPSWPGSAAGSRTRASSRSTSPTGSTGGRRSPGPRRWRRSADPELVESATRRDDLDGMRAFAQHSRWPHSEHVVSTSHAWRLLRHGAVDILNLSPYVLGGLTPALRVADFAAVAGVGVLVGTTQEAGRGHRGRGRAGRRCAARRSSLRQRGAAAVRGRRGGRSRALPGRAPAGCPPGPGWAWRSTGRAWRG